MMFLFTYTEKNLPNIIIRNNQKGIKSVKYILSKNNSPKFIDLRIYQYYQTLFLHTLGKKYKEQLLIQ